MEKKYWYGIGGAAVVALIIGLWMYGRTVYRTEISDFTLSPQVADAAGVASTTSFLLKTTADLSPQVIDKYLKVTPKTPMRVTKVEGSPRTYELAPRATLAANTVYTIAIEKGPLASRTFSWAYQVKAPFQVLSTIPGHQATNVPTNTGIEVEFNRSGIKDPERYIEITPAVPGRYEVRDKTVRFIPSDPLQERTVYTVRIKQGLSLEESSDTIDQEKTIQFETAVAYQSSYLYPQRQFSEFKPGSEIQFGMNAYAVSETSAIVYRFASLEEYAAMIGRAIGDTSWAIHMRDISKDISVSKQVFSGKLPVEEKEYAHVVRLPKELPVGYYLLMLSSGKSNALAWFQVNQTASFIAIAGKQSLVWLKNADTGAPAANIPIRYEGKELAQTNKEGIALFATPQDFTAYTGDPYQSVARKFFIAAVPGAELMLPIENEYGYASRVDAGDAWWDFISLNKNIFLPTDTVRFFGVIKPRDASRISDSRDITVSLSTPYWDEVRPELIPAPLKEETLRLSGHHTITGEFSYKDLKPGTYELTFTHKGEIVSKQTVSVGAYVAPAYKLIVTPSKSAIFAGDPVTFTLKAEFFDGTPVSNTKFQYDAYLFGRPYFGTIQANSTGEASFTISPEYQETNSSYWPSYLYLTVRPVHAEEAEIQGTATILVFGPTVYQEVKEEEVGGMHRFTVKSWNLALPESLSGDPYWDMTPYLGATADNLTTTVDLSEISYREQKTGTGYDPINKLSYPIYRYEMEETPIYTKSIVAHSGGEAVYDLVPVPQKTYKLVFSGTDARGRRFQTTRYVYGASQDAAYEYGEYYYLKSSKERDIYSVGEEVRLSLQTEQGAQPASGSGKFLFLTVVNGEMLYRIQDGPNYRTTFEKAYIPNAGIWPAWFANGRFHNASLRNVSFDTAEKRLSIEVTKNQDSYIPGAQVELTVRVKDARGNPVRAEVNLSALDEAIFSIRPDDTDPLESLYRDVYSSLLIRTSHTPPYGGGGAEKGGGDGGAPRSNIAESALYKTVETDSTGYARVRFTLPDNLTSWRITAQAATRDLGMGKHTSFIPVTLPFFVNATLNKTYLTGDELALRVRSFGSRAFASTVAYSIESPTLPFKKRTAQGGSQVTMALGKLTEGMHKLTIRADAGDFSDALTREVRVLPTYFTEQKADFYEFTPQLKITNNALGYTTLVFSSLSRGRIYDALNSMRYQDGLRLDQRGAALAAQRLLAEHFGDTKEQLIADIAPYQDYSGGLRLLPYSSEELEISAIGVNVLPKSALNENLLKEYFFHVLEDPARDPGRVVRALYGLAALGEPVLVELERLAHDRALTKKDELFVALALDALGAKESARSYYKEKIAPDIKTKVPYAYLTGPTKDYGILATALAAALTARLEEPVSASLARYAEENHPSETLSAFERLLYYQAILPTLDAREVRFSYEAGKKVGTETLSSGETVTLSLHKDELGKLKITDVEGELAIHASYEVLEDPKNTPKDPDILLSRTYTLEGGGVGRSEFKDGDLVRVQLMPTFKKGVLGGMYQITDFLPSGLRAVEQEHSEYYKYDSREYPIEINDQKVTFLVDPEYLRPIYYYARVVSKGTYKAEPALMQSTKSPSSMTISDEYTIVIK